MFHGMFEEVFLANMLEAESSIQSLSLRIVRICLVGFSYGNSHCMSW